MGRLELNSSYFSPCEPTPENEPEPDPKPNTEPAVKRLCVGVKNSTEFPTIQIAGRMNITIN